VPPESLSPLSSLAPPKEQSGVCVKRLAQPLNGFNSWGVFLVLNHLDIAAIDTDTMSKFLL
jgi:hypothetical protein